MDDINAARHHLKELGYTSAQIRDGRVFLPHTHHWTCEAHGKGGAIDCFKSNCPFIPSKDLCPDCKKERALAALEASPGLAMSDAEADATFPPFGKPRPLVNVLEDLKERIQDVIQESADHLARIHVLDELEIWLDLLQEAKGLIV